MPWWLAWLPSNGSVRWPYSEEMYPDSTGRPPGTIWRASSRVMMRFCSAVSWRRRSSICASIVSSIESSAGTTGPSPAVSGPPTAGGCSKSNSPRFSCATSVSCLPSASRRMSCACMRPTRVASVATWSSTSCSMRASCSLCTARSSFQRASVNSLSGPVPPQRLPPSQAPAMRATTESPAAVYAMTRFMVIMTGGLSRPCRIGAPCQKNPCNSSTLITHSGVS